MLFSKHDQIGVKLLTRLFSCDANSLPQKDNLHNEFCLIDPPVISFDGESLLNSVLYGSDKYNNKINKEILFCRHRGYRGGAWPLTFLCGKNKKGKQRKKSKSLKAETIKRLSLRSKCYCFSNVYCFILECLEFKYFSVFHGPFTSKSICRPRQIYY